jgi:NAD(P)-dependent dehydrogenase (short-subunit alcohol dehydrogenase family)
MSAWTTPWTRRRYRLEVLKELARKGAYVVMAARDQKKAEAARASINTAIPGALLELQSLDLALLASVYQAAARILANHPRIDLLVNNAGLMGIAESSGARMGWRCSSP